MGPADPLSRSVAGSDQVLGTWDDYPVHQSAALIGSVQPALPGWSERFYFNVIAPTGELLAILGAGIYPMLGVSECYFCHLDGALQVNLRSFGELPAPGRELVKGPFSLYCERPLRDWTVSVELDDLHFAGRFGGLSSPYLFEPIDVPASEPGGEFDLYRHFVAIGEWQLEQNGGLTAASRLLGVRDRTWGVRSRRIRWHNWCVLELGGRTLTLIHQELADGAVMHSEVGVVHPDGETERLRIAGHDVTYDPHDRELTRARWSLTGEHGDLELFLERVGFGMRLAGAGYDGLQGGRRTASVQRDSYDLGDPEVARRTGRGTVDQGVRAHVSGAWTADGIGVAESAIARDHVRYGSQLA
jgi:hypothetical protein